LIAPLACHVQHSHMTYSVGSRRLLLKNFHETITETPETAEREMQSEEKGMIESERKRGNSKATENHNRMTYTFAVMLAVAFF